MKYLISFIVLLLSTNLLFAQSRHFEYYDEYLELGYNGQVNQGQLSAGLTITDLSTGVVYNFGMLNIDVSSENYKLGIASQLITKASQIDAGQNTAMSDVLLRKIVNAMSNTAGRYGSVLSASELKTEEVEGFFLL
jgi:hypothetical protein